MKTITSSASAKVILFGEHAVVYGKPALAMPISSLRSYVSITEHKDQALRIIAEDLQETYSIRTIEPTETNESGLVKIVKYTLNELAYTQPPKININIHSEIPIASGLGSGASISTAIARTLSTYTDRVISDERLNQLVYEVEKLYHGSPSGIDNTVIVYERPVFFQQGQPLQPLHILRPLYFIIANTGIPAPTREAVNDVRQLVLNTPEKTNMILERIGEISMQARQELMEGDEESLGRLMQENHNLLRRLTVSSVQLDTLVDAAIHAGAYGSKMSGGGRGGNMIALVDESRREAVEQALYAAGAKRVIGTRLK